LTKSNIKLHESVIKEMIRLFQTYGGHRSEVRLARELRNLNLSLYRQQSTGKDVIVETKALLERSNKRT